MKLCVDCKHHFQDYEGEHICTVHLSPVTGDVIERDCNTERASLTITKLPVGESITGCGPEGNLWKLK